MKRNLYLYAMFVALQLSGCNKFEELKAVNQEATILCKTSNHPSDEYLLDEKNSKVRYYINANNSSVLNKADFIWDANFTHQTISWVAKYKHGYSDYELNRASGRLVISTFYDGKFNDATQYECERLSQKF
jgi:hypothetical protein